MKQPLKWRSVALVSTLFWALIMAVSCSKTDKTAPEAIQETRLSHARNFTIEHHENYKLIRVMNPWKGATQNFIYVLSELPVEELNVEYDAFIALPISNLVCTSTSHLPMLELLGEGEKLSGFPNTDLISSKSLVQRVESGEIIEIGEGMGLNIEQLIDLSPGLVINYATGSEFDQLDLLKRSNIPFILNADYMENTPLGRAEWIKFFGAIFDKENMADSIFQAIENRYESLRSGVSNSDTRPAAFTGVMYGDTWFLPGGQNYASVFFRDAGADYIWKNDPEIGWLELGFESVYDKAAEAEFWLGCASFESLEEMGATDQRYVLFQSFQKGKVYNYNARMGKNGGNDYLELGYARPDIVLADLIHILHPNALPDHELFFYQQLK